MNPKVKRGLCPEADGILGSGEASLFRCLSFSASPFLACPAPPWLAMILLARTERAMRLPPPAG